MARRGLQNQQRVAIHKAIVKAGGVRGSINPTIIINILSSVDRAALKEVLSSIRGITDLDRAVRLVAPRLGMA